MWKKVRKNKWGFFLLMLIMLSSTSQAYADVNVKGYFRKDGTYVMPHFRSDPDGYFFNNWSTYGNINPYTGEGGTKRFKEYNFSPYSYNPYSYRSNENSYENPNFSLDNIYDHNTIVEDTNTTPLKSESSENINIVDSYIKSYDSADEIAAKNMLVEYFNNINTRSYIPAYDCWVTKWQNKHPYDSFEEGFVDVIINIDELNSVSTDNVIDLEGTITAKEGWEQTSQQYHFVYTTRDIDGTWKIAKGKIKKLW